MPSLQLVSIAPHGMNADPGREADLRIPSRTFRSAFSLIETLAVMAIGGLLVVFAIIGTSSMGRAKDITRAAYEIADLLQMARTHSLAKNIPVEIGFYEDSEGISIAVIAEREPGGNEFSQLGRVKVFRAVRLNAVPADNPVRPVADARISGLADGISSFTVNGREFNRVIHFNSRGEARVADDSLSRVIEVDLVSTIPDTSAASPGANSAAVQVTALAGGVRVYRP